MKKLLLILLNIYCFVAEIIGSFIIIMFFLAFFALGGAKFEVGSNNWNRCFGDCQKVEQIHKEGVK